MTDKKMSADDSDELRAFASSPCYLHELDENQQVQPHADERASVQHERKNQRRELIEQRNALDSGEMSRTESAISQTIEKEQKVR